MLYNRGYELKAGKYKGKRMKKIEIEIQEIPHGHGMSFKKGIADGLLDSRVHKDVIHDTHRKSYNRGLVIGAELKLEIAMHVKSVTSHNGNV